MTMLITCDVLGTSKDDRNDQGRFGEDETVIDIRPNTERT